MYKTCQIDLVSWLCLVSQHCSVIETDIFTYFKFQICTHGTYEITVWSFWMTAVLPGSIITAMGIACQVILCLTVKNGTMKDRNNAETHQVLTGRQLKRLKGPLISSLVPLSTCLYLCSGIGIVHDYYQDITFQNIISAYFIFTILVPLSCFFLVFQKETEFEQKLRNKQRMMEINQLEHEERMQNKQTNKRRTQDDQEQVQFELVPIMNA